MKMNTHHIWGTMNLIPHGSQKHRVRLQAHEDALFAA